jgi:hypothetical protein
LKLICCSSISICTPGLRFVGIEVHIDKDIVFSLTKFLLI